MPIATYTPCSATYYLLDRLAGSRLVGIICNGNASWTDETDPAEFASSWASILATELPAIDGYSRGDYGILGNPVWSSSDRQWKIVPPNSSVTYSPIGGNWSYDGLVWVVTNQLTPNKEVTDIDTSNNTFTVNAHNLTIDDRVMVTVDAPGLLPGGVSDELLYYARSVTANTFKISTTPSDAGIVDISSVGSLGTYPIRLRYGNYVTVLSRIKITSSIAADGSPLSIPFYVGIKNDDLSAGLIE